MICVNLAYSEIGVGRATSMLMLVASGTAVRATPIDEGQDGDYALPEFTRGYKRLIWP